MEKDKITENLMFKILREIKDLREDKMNYLQSLLAEAEIYELPDMDFVVKCKKAIAKNKTFRDPDVREYLSGFELSKLLGIEEEVK